MAMTADPAIAELRDWLEAQKNRYGQFPDFTSAAAQAQFNTWYRALDRLLRASEWQPTPEERKEAAALIQTLSKFEVKIRAMRGWGAFDYTVALPNPALVKVLAWLRCESTDGDNNG